MIQQFQLSEISSFRLMAQRASADFPSPRLTGMSIYDDDGSIDVLGQSDWELTLKFGPWNISKIFE